MRKATSLMETSWSEARMMGSTSSYSRNTQINSRARSTKNEKELKREPYETFKYISRTRSKKFLVKVLVAYNLTQIYIGLC
jgi:hypothetical protein